MDKINFAKEDPSLLGEEKNELFYLGRYATRSSSYRSKDTSIAIRVYPTNARWIPTRPRICRFALLRTGHHPRCVSILRFNAAANYDPVNMGYGPSTLMCCGGILYCDLLPPLPNRLYSCKHILFSEARKVCDATYSFMF